MHADRRNHRLLDVRTYGLDRNSTASIDSIFWSFLDRLPFTTQLLDGEFLLVAMFVVSFTALSLHLSCDFVGRFRECDKFNIKLYHSFFIFAPHVVAFYSNRIASITPPYKRRNQFTTCSKCSMKIGHNRSKWTATQNRPVELLQWAIFTMPCNTEPCTQDSYDFVIVRLKSRQLLCRPCEGNLYIECVCVCVIKMCTREIVLHSLRLAFCVLCDGDSKNIYYFYRFQLFGTLARRPTTTNLIGLFFSFVARAFS